MELDKTTLDALKRLNVHVGWKNLNRFQPMNLSLQEKQLPVVLSKISFTGNEDDLMELLNICLKLKEIRGSIVKRG